MYGSLYCVRDRLDGRDLQRYILTTSIERLRCLLSFPKTSPGYSCGSVPTAKSRQRWDKGTPLGNGSRSRSCQLRLAAASWQQLPHTTTNQKPPHAPELKLWRCAIWPPRSFVIAPRRRHPTNLVLPPTRTADTTWPSSQEPRPWDSKITKTHYRPELQPSERERDHGAARVPQREGHAFVSAVCLRL